MPEIKLIVGLGNPGEKYAVTRHNAGFMTAGLLALKWGLSWKGWSGLAELSGPSEGRGVYLAMPQTFMNLSGAAVKKLLGYKGLEPSQMLVISDDFSLALGKIRLRASGSAGGHNGLSSIIDNLGTQEFPRLRLGIGPLPENTEPSDFVLSRFSQAEKGALEEMIKQAAGTVESLLENGWEKTISSLPKQPDVPPDPKNI